MIDVGRQSPLRCRAPRRGWLLAPLLLTALLAGCSYTPDLDPKPIDPSASSRILAANGSVLARVDLGEHRDPVSLRQMATSLPKAVVAIEDHRFFQHDGVDYRAIARALRDDLAAGKVVAGGSTITQQYVRNVLLTNERTVHRKLHEAILAMQLESKYTKHQILERYLNAVYFGNGAYGAQVAAERYFRTDAQHLTLPQSALLAALLKAPEDYDPYRHRTRALARRNAVLAAMHRYGLATKAQVDAATLAPLTVAPSPSRSSELDPYFVRQVEHWFLANPAFGATQQQRAHLLYQGGLRITTTLDATAQAEAQRAVAHVLSDRAHDPAASLVAIDPRNGHVIAYVGGRGYEGPEPWAQYDLAGAPGRPTGSTFKPIVLASALERHIALSTTFDGPATLDLKQPDGRAWQVHNYDNESFGKLDLVDATVHSVNTVYAQLMLQVGPQYAVEMAHRFGIGASLLPYPCAVLGCNAVSTLAMASAYATLAADGVAQQPVFVTRVVDGHGTVLWEATPSRHRVVSADIARTVNQVLQQVVTRGTGVNARIGRPVAAKTGTSDNWADAWFVGSTPQLTAAVWVGFPDAETAMLPPRTRIKVTGGSWPAQIWAQFAGAVLAEQPVLDFPSPSPGAADGVLPSAPLPNVVGMPASRAEQLLRDAGYKVAEQRVANGDYPPGTVVAQTPEPRTAVRADTVVTLTIAADQSQVVNVPLLLGLDAAAARAAAAGAGVTVKIVTLAEPPPGAASRLGKIWKQSIAAGTAVVRGTVVTVWLNPSG